MRVISWFSCGAASAVATKLALAEVRKTGDELVIAYTEVVEEHEDNKRFLRECEEWFGQKIVVLRNEKYAGSIYEVFKGGYLVGPGGAPCSLRLKKRVREEFERPGDRQVFGYTAEEQDRVDRFIDANASVDLWVPLIEQHLSKADCLAILRNANIELPVMYKLGYKNNNCVGCVKGQAGYWNKIRVDFPHVFERMAQVEDKLNRCVCKVSVNGKEKRVKLRDLPPNAGRYEAEADIACGLFCYMAEENIYNKRVVLEEADELIYGEEL
jgi:hypothetical protein